MLKRAADVMVVVHTRIISDDHMTSHLDFLGHIHKREWVISLHEWRLEKMTGSSQLVGYVVYIHTYISMYCTMERVADGCVPQFANFESVMDHIIWKARPPTRLGRGGGEEDKKKLWKWTCQLYCDVIFWSGAHHTYVCVYARIEGLQLYNKRV